MLVDEIDLHLRQQFLMHTFPNTQFIVTTHSPQVLTGQKREHLHP